MPMSSHKSKDIVQGVEDLLRLQKLPTDFFYLVSNDGNIDV